MPNEQKPKIPSFSWEDTFYMLASLSGNLDVVNQKIDAVWQFLNEHLVVEEHPPERPSERIWTPGG